MLQSYLPVAAQGHSQWPGDRSSLRAALPGARWSCTGRKHPLSAACLFCSRAAWVLLAVHKHCDVPISPFLPQALEEKMGLRLEQLEFILAAFPERIC